MTTPSLIPVARAPNGNVYALIAAWARRAGRRQLVTWAVGGALDAVGIAAVRPSWWLAAAPFACVAAIGAWGLAAKREVLEVAAAAPRARRLRLLRIARVAAVAVGTAAAVAAFYGALWLVFGTRWGPSGG